jgi:hypothetical protein
MTDALYKVSRPRDDWTFGPGRFWRTEDWSFSDDRPHDGLIEDRVLYAAPLEEINIHLMPEVWRLRVWLDDEERCRELERLGFTWETECHAIIFALESDRDTIESSCPTVYAFDRAGFERAPTVEFVSGEPREAVSAETVSFAHARRRWRFDVLYGRDPDDLVHRLGSAGVDHQVQT